jgi:hypothetical protein
LANNSPPQTIQAAWTHLQREAPISFCVIDAAALPAATASRLGLDTAPNAEEAGGVGDPRPRDALLFGTAKGGIIVCDASRRGRQVLQMPAFR